MSGDSIRTSELYTAKPDIMSGLYNVYGNNGSPYTCKLRSYLRFKRIHFNFLQVRASDPKFMKLRPQTIPMIEFPNNGEVMNESTTILKRFEAMEKYKTRSIFAPTSSLHFLGNFLEDFADEWLTKMMFSMRWLRKIDQDFSSQFLMRQLQIGGSQKAMQGIAKGLAKRQVDRCELVGCENEALMHASFHLICGILEEYLKRNWCNKQIFLFGKRPSNADFAFYGQMKQFTVDPTPAAMIHEQYPAVYAWLAVMDDLSGWTIDDTSNDAWVTLDEIVKDDKHVIVELLRVCGDIYLPFLKANADAYKANEKWMNVKLKVGGQYFEHKQPRFGWQVKCYKSMGQQMRAALASCKEHEREKLVSLLKATNCYDLLSQAPTPGSKL